MKAEFELYFKCYNENEDFILLTYAADVEFIPPIGLKMLIDGVNFNITAVLYVMYTTECKAYLAIELDSFVFDSWEECIDEAKKWIEDGKWFILDGNWHPNDES